MCLLCIELSDFVFAVDSIPAVLGVSKARCLPCMTSSQPLTHCLERFVVTSRAPPNQSTRPKPHQDPLIVYSSNIFAIMALRSLYTLVATAVNTLEYIKPVGARVHATRWLP